MKVALPSGGTAEFRDTLLRGDVRDARKGIVVVIGPDGSQRSDGSITDEITGRMIRKMLISWDVGQPLPRDAQTDDLAQAILDKLPDEDYEALEKAVGPWVEKVMRRRAGVTFVHGATGARVEAASPKDEALLAGSPEFSREGDTDPKSASPRSVTSSSASQEPDGPESTPTLSPSN